MFDRILYGMVGVGLVQEAICAFLLLTIEMLSYHLVRLDLPAPSDRPMRKPSGKRPWTVEDVRFLISLWTGNIRAEAIGAELGRSAGSVRSKARRVGLYRRNRRDLVAAAAQAQQAPKTPANPISADAPASTEAPPLVAEPPAVIAEAPAVAGRPPKRRRSRRIVWSDDLDLKVARRWFAWQCRHGIAKDLGLTEGQVRSRATRMGLPPRERIKIVPDYVEGRPYDTCLEDSVVRRRCVEGKMFFYADRHGPHTSPKIMKTKRYKELRSGLGESYSYG